MLPDPTVLGPLLAPLGGDPSIDVHRRAHYFAMANKSRAIVGEADWHEYDLAYVESIGVARRRPRARGRRARPHPPRATCGDGRSPSRWRPLVELAAAGVPDGGRVERVRADRDRNSAAAASARSVPGAATPVRCIVDSHVVGVAKPDPRIFEHALPSFPGVAPERIVYVGDSVTMDIGGRGCGRTAPDPDRSRTTTMPTPTSSASDRSASCWRCSRPELGRPAEPHSAAGTSRRAITLRHRVSSAPSKIDSTRASTNRRLTAYSSA